MKRMILTLVCLLSLALTFMTCKKDEGNLTIRDSKELTQTANADEKTTGKGFTFTAKKSWTASVKESTKIKGSGVSWIKLLYNGVETYSGGAGTFTIIVSLEQNTVQEPRYATIEIVSGNDKIIISVMQKGKSGSEEDSGTTGPLIWNFANGVLTISGSGAMPNYDLKYENGQFVGISSPWYKYKDLIITIIIGNSVTSIGDYAFSNFYYLYSVKIGNNVKRIGQWAFSSTGLEEIEIPQSVEKIGEWAFHICEVLSNITISSVNLSFEGRGAFTFGGKSRNIVITLSDDVQEIKENADFDVDNKYPPNLKLIIGSKVQRIEKNFFFNAFYTEIDSRQKNPPKIFDNTFNNIRYYPMVFVEKGCFDVYKATDVWKDFEIIEKN